MSKSKLIIESVRQLLEVDMDSIESPRYELTIKSDEPFTDEDVKNLEGDLKDKFKKFDPIVDVRKKRKLVLILGRQEGYMGMHFEVLKSIEKAVLKSLESTAGTVKIHWPHLHQ